MLDTPGLKHFEVNEFIFLNIECSVLYTTSCIYTVLAISIGAVGSRDPLHFYINEYSLISYLIYYPNDIHNGLSLHQGHGDLHNG